MINIALVLCIISSIVIILLMKKAVNYQKEEWYKNSKKEIKEKVSMEIKEFWKVSIRNIAMNLAAIILLISFLKDKPNFIINGVIYFSFGYSIVAVLIIIYGFIKLNKSVNVIKE